MTFVALAFFATSIYFFAKWSNKTNQYEVLKKESEKHFNDAVLLASMVKEYQEENEELIKYLKESGKKPIIKGKTYPCYYSEFA